MSRLDIHFKPGENGADLLFYRSVIPLAIVSREGTFVEANSAFSGFFGYLPNEILGKSFSQYTHPEDVDADKEAINQLLAREHDLTHYEMDKRYISKRGDIIWFRLFVDAVWIKNSDSVSDSFSHFYVVASPYPIRGKQKTGNTDRIVKPTKVFNPIKWVKENKLAAAFIIAIAALIHPDIVRSILELLK